MINQISALLVQIPGLNALDYSFYSFQLLVAELTPDDQNEDRANQEQCSNDPLHPGEFRETEHGDHDEEVEVDLAPSKVQEQEPLVDVALLQLHQQNDDSERNEVEGHDEGAKRGSTHDADNRHY